jgi:hypothetical protein
MHASPLQQPPTAALQRSASGRQKVEGAQSPPLHTSPGPQAPFAHFSPYSGARGRASSIVSARTSSAGASIGTDPSSPFVASGRSGESSAVVASEGPSLDGFGGSGASITVASEGSSAAASANRPGSLGPHPNVAEEIARVASAAIRTDIEGRAD